MTHHIFLSKSPCMALTHFAKHLPLAAAKGFESKNWGFQKQLQENKAPNCVSDHTCMHLNFLELFEVVDHGGLA